MERGQVRGVVLGLAIGDALGFPAEFRTREAIIETFGSQGMTDMVGIHDPRWPQRPLILGPSHPPGTYTDDTQMSIALAQGLLDALDQPLDAQLDAVGRRFVTWSDSPQNNRAPGSTCMEGCARLAEGMPWREAGVADSKGCGAAMRVAPIGVLYAHDHARLLEIARASSVLTHGHPAAVESAAAAALMVALAGAGARPAEIYEALMATCAPRDADLARCLARVPELLDAPPEVALSDEGLGESWVADEAVASAMYCVWRHPDDYAAAVLMAANTTGDSDTIACITGGVLGARLGVEAIPARWRAQVEDAAALTALGDALYDGAQALRRAAAATTAGA